MKNASFLGIGRQDVTRGRSRTLCSLILQWLDLMNSVTVGEVMEAHLSICRTLSVFLPW